MSRKSRVDAWGNSVSFALWLFEFNQGSTAEEHKRMLMDSMEYHGARRKFPREGKILSPVEFAKWALGKQDYTWTGSYRNWVWERGVWRLFVNNHQGFSLEVKEGLTIEQARQVWDEVRARLGAFDMFPAGTRVLAYVDDEPGESLGPDSKHPGHFHVSFDSGVKSSVHIDNLRPA